MHCDTCVCVCVCLYQFYHMRESVQLWKQSTHRRVPSPQESLVRYFWNASHPVLLPTPPSPKPWRQESVLHFYSFVILIYLRHFWVCFLCGALHGDGSRHGTTHMGPAVHCKPAHRHILPVEWGVKAPRHWGVLTVPTSEYHDLEHQVLQLLFPLSNIIYKTQRGEPSLACTGVSGVFFVVTVVPSSFLMLQNCFSPHFLSVWTFPLASC